MKFVVPLAVGVPEIKPEFGEMVRPEGSGAEAGEIDQVKGAAPPLAATAFE
jgi:hypothetical protein